MLSIRIQSLLLSALSILSFALSSATAKRPDFSLPPGETPLTDPQDDPNNPLRYLPNNTLTAVGVALYFVTSCSMVLLLFMSRWKARYMLCVIIGGFGEFPILELRGVVPKLGGT